MRKAFLIAALMIMTGVGVAHAGDSFSFQINGQHVHIERPRNCTSLSCLNIVAPGLMKSDSDDAGSTTSSNSSNSTSNVAPIAPQTNQANVAPAPVQQQAPVAATNSYAPPVATVPPLPGQNSNAANNDMNVTSLPGQTSNVTTLPAPVQPQAQQQYVYAPAQQPQPNVYAPAPAPAQQTAAVQPQVQQPQQAANGPIGMWMTEKNEGRVHVVNCGGKICGYAVDDRTGADGEQVLINMTPDADGWRGKIHDTRSGGTYDSTIAMRGNDRMRVQGCAFGGMFCGGQTWSRVN